MKSLKNLRDAIIRAHERGKNRSKLQNFLEYQRALSTMPSNDIKKLETMKTGREEVERKMQEAERTFSALKE